MIVAKSLDDGRRKPAAPAVVHRLDHEIEGSPGPKAEIPIGGSVAATPVMHSNK